LNVSEPKAEQSSGEPGSASAGQAAPHSADAQIQPVEASAQEPMREPVREPEQQPLKASTDVESPRLAPEQGNTAETPDVDGATMDAPKSADSGSDAPQVEDPKADAASAAGKVMIMLSDDRTSDSDGAGVEPEPEQSEQSKGTFGKRRAAALAAVVALAAVTGALGGALAIAGLRHFVGDDAAASANRALEASVANRALEASVARIDADLLALKASVEHTSKLGTSQLNKTSDRLDKLEKAQAEPAAKLARLSEAVDKLRAAQQVSAPPAAPAPVAAKPAAQAPVAAAPGAAKETTGSIASPAAAPAAAPKAEAARLPTVEGWVLRDVANGAALIEGRQGMYEVYAGDPVPGLGRVDAIRRQDGRWVVVTSKGLVVAR
jgi:hypothetical protein